MYQFRPELFNPPQRQAVLHDEGPMLVLAGAGSGKTRIIAHRVAYLVDIRNVAPDHIVAVSFTNKAARELKGRVAELIGQEKARQCHLSTFHALGADILRAHITKLGWKLPYAIIDTDEQLGIVRSVLKELHLQGSSYDPQDLLGFISRVKTAHVMPLDMPGMRWKPQGRTLAKIFDHYQIIRKSMNAIDFDDMIALPVDIFEKYDDVRAQYADAWKYLLVDEYQDTNELQFKLLQLLCRQRANLMVVGDDDQSIYAFRGANSQHILDFPKLFQNVRVIALEQNYRSTQPILTAANAVIAKNAVRHQKNLWSEHQVGEKIRVFACSNPEEEARFVVDQISLQRAAKNLSYRDFAILYRTNPQSRAIEEQLVKQMLPYRIVGGSKFYDQSEVRDLVFYLRSIYSFHDELALRRIINTPRRGVAAAALERIDARAKNENLSFLDAVRAEIDHGQLQAAARLKLTEWVEVLESFHRRVMSKNEPLSVTLTALIERIHYIAYLQSSCNSDQNAQHRRDNVDELVEALAAYERQNGRDLSGFLQQLMLDPPKKEDDENPDEITLLTLHAAKGLEFTSVYIVGCEENLLPHANSLREPELSEERRLFYVGITRAKQFLTITHTNTRKKMYETLRIMPSRFLSDIPKDVVEFAQAEDSISTQAMKEEQHKTMKSRFAQLQSFFDKKA